MSTAVRYFSGNELQAAVDAAAARAREHPLQVIRFLTHEARECRGRGVGDAICVLLPVLAAHLGVDGMTDDEARAFLSEIGQAFKNDLRRVA